MAYTHREEAQIEEYLINTVRLLRGNIRKVRWPGRRGAPDRFVWVPGWKFPKLIELKRPGKIPTLQQEEEIKRLRKMHIEVLVIDNREDIDKCLLSSNNPLARLSPDRIRRRRSILS